MASIYLSNEKPTNHNAVQMSNVSELYIIDAEVLRILELDT